jgi:hypothetical protein
LRQPAAEGCHRRFVRTDLTIIPLMPAHYFAVYLLYRDARTDAKYQQEMFYFWLGTGPQDFDMSFEIPWSRSGSE